jgi:hypothetical protein
MTPRRSSGKSIQSPARIRSFRLAIVYGASIITCIGLAILFDQLIGIDEVCDKVTSECKDRLPYDALRISSMVLAFALGAIALLHIGLQWFDIKDEVQLHERADLSETEIEQLSEGSLEIGVLWRRTEERLRIYHNIATRQANISFISAQIAIALGFLVVLATAAMAGNADKDSTRIVIGILGAAGAMLSAFIGRTFIRSQENAASHLRSYFGQPQEFFRYLAAERILDKFKDDSNLEIVAKLVAAMVSGAPSVESEIEYNSSEIRSSDSKKDSRADD